ncbi:MAG: cysteine hydrolase [Candidatus Eisenbacteria bacterium]|nr:cysteine hydrolase [Candidatus Eisenbacteria bacterium]
MQVAFFERVPALAVQRAALVAAINELVGAFRRAERPILWVRQEFAADLSDAFLDMRRNASRITIAGTPGAELLPELDRKAHDPVIVKQRYSAFFRTALEEVLAPWGAVTLVIAGINTHACVRTTAIDAYQRDIEVLLARDGIASGDAEHHDVTLRYLDEHIVRIQTNPQLLAHLEGA